MGHDKVAAKTTSTAAPTIPSDSHTKPSHIADVALTTDCGRREGTVIQHEVRKSNKKQVKKQQMVFQTPKRHFKFPY